MSQPLSRSLAEDAVRSIRDRIVSGEFQLGEALSEVTLAASLGMSKTPVREALMRLSTDGLVEVRPQRGTYVFTLAPDQVGHLSALREVLEIAALRSAEPRADRLVESLEGLLDRMSRALARNDVGRYRVLDGEFHRAFFDAAGNPFLAEAFDRIAFLIQALRNRLSREPSLNERSFREHRRLAELVAGGAFEKAESLLRQHVRVTGREYAERIEGSAPIR